MAKKPTPRKAPAKKAPAKKAPAKRKVSPKNTEGREGRAGPPKPDRNPRPKRKLHPSTSKKSSDAFLAYRAARLEERRLKNGGQPVGRPYTYLPECALIAHAMARMGATPQEMAIEMGVSPVTVYTWMQDEPEFLKAVEAGKAVYDERVESRLYERAIGYTYEAEEIFSYQGEIVRADVIKHIPPDVSAIQFWLTNRRPERWKQIKHQVEYPMGTAERLTLTDDQLMETLHAKGGKKGSE